MTHIYIPKYYLVHTNNSTYNMFYHLDTFFYNLRVTWPFAKCVWPKWLHERDMVCRSRNGMVLCTHTPRDGIDFERDRHRAAIQGKVPYRIYFINKKKVPLGGLQSLLCINIAITNWHIFLVVCCNFSKCFMNCMNKFIA